MIKLEIAETILIRWKQTEREEMLEQPEYNQRLGFFDGGSRGNPGAGGSGSVVIQLGGHATQLKPVWAAATALGRKETTNNVAEFVGLHRLLKRAVESDWFGINIVGDSALIVGMMEHRRPPKAKKLQYWYCETRRMADLCAVRSWRHHYRRHNKMADWLANQAMDTGRSLVWTEQITGRESRPKDGVLKLMIADVEQWTKESSARRAE